MTGPELDEIITRTVSRTLEAFGVDTKNAAETRADFVHLRRWRLLVERGTMWAVYTIVGSVVVGLLAAAKTALGH